jgi:hypothetical protein
MKHLILLAAILCSLFTALIMTSIQAGTQVRESSPDLNYIDLCDHQFCFMGITPGITTIDQAAAILQPYIDKPVNTPYILSGHVGHSQFYVAQAPDAPAITVLVIRYPDPIFVGLDNLVARYGSPCSVGFPDTGPNMTLHYPFMHVSVTPLRTRSAFNLTDYRISFESAVTIDANAKHDDMCQHDRGNLPWLGFRSLTTYLSQAMHREIPANN